MKPISDEKLIGMLDSVARANGSRSVAHRAATAAAERLRATRMRHAVGIRTPNVEAVERMGLPVPRLQFRWEATERDEDGYEWFCHYELVLGLQKYDIRNPNECKAPGELAVALGGCRRGSDRAPYWPEQKKVDTPFRDHSHSVWDGLQLGGLPIYAIYGDRVSVVDVDYAAQRTDPPEWNVTKTPHQPYSG